MLAISFILCALLQGVHPQRGPDLTDPPFIDFTSSTPVEEFVVNYAPVRITDQRNNNMLVAEFNTRMYCWGNPGCTIPAATFIMHPTVPARIRICNNLTGLGPEILTEQYVEDLGYTPFKDQDVVNLHVHGLHVSPTEDDVVHRLQKPFCPPGVTPAEGWNCIAPGQPMDCQLYNFTLPSYHYPGSHWWHTHWHGAVTLQVAGGMYGAISVDLPAGNLNRITMPSNWMILGYVYAQTSTADCGCTAPGVRTKAKPGIVTAQGVSGRQGFPIPGRCMMVCQYLANSTSSSGMDYTMTVGSNPSEFYLVNGKYQPTKNLTTGVYHRFRVVVTSVNYVFLALNDTGNKCDFYLLSTDGIAFETGGRDVNAAPYFGSVVIPIGGRADVAIRCREQGRYQLYARHANLGQTPAYSAAFSAENKKAFDEMKKTSADCQQGTSFTFPTIQNDFMLMDLDVQGNTTFVTGAPGAADGVNPWPYSNTMYLAETRNLPVNSYTADTSHPVVTNTAMQTTNLVLPSRPLAQSPRASTPLVPMATGMNNVSFSDRIPMFNFQTDTVHEWTVYIRYHPYHHHIWPFQLQSSFPNFIGLPAVANSTGWFAQGGDWRDVVGLYGSLIIRVNYVAGGPDRDVILNNILVMHCHFVFHEDWGMMQWFNMSVTPQPSLDYSLPSSFTLSPIGFTGIGPSNVTVPRLCQPTGGAVTTGKVTVVSRVLDASFSLEIAQLGDSQTCYGVIFSGQARSNIENFYVGYSVGNSSASCATGTGIAMRLQVFNDMNNGGLRRYQAIPVLPFSPFPTASPAQLAALNLVCDAPVETAVPTINSFTYNIECTFSLASAAASRAAGLQDIFTGKDGVRVFGWSYGEGIGTADFPRYTNQNVQGCPLTLTSRNLTVASVAQTATQVNLGPIENTCEYGYFNLIKFTPTAYTSRFIVCTNTDGTCVTRPTSVPAPQSGTRGTLSASATGGVVVGIFFAVFILGMCGLAIYCCKANNENEGGAEEAAAMQLATSNA